MLRPGTLIGSKHGKQHSAAEPLLKSHSFDTQKEDPPPSLLGALPAAPSSPLPGRTLTCPPPPPRPDTIGTEQIIAAITRPREK